MALVGHYLRRFFSPSEYESGRRAGVWACIYLVVALLVIISSAADANPNDETGLLYVATAPLSIFFLMKNTQGAGLLAALAFSALINAFVFWVIFRGSSHYPRHHRTLRP
jgi:hypothetical protein